MKKKQENIIIENKKVIKWENVENREGGMEENEREEGKDKRGIKRKTRKRR